MAKIKAKSVSNCLKDIIEELTKLSGYPYSDSDPFPNQYRAFAYGLAIGTLSRLQHEYEQREHQAAAKQA